jgi:hypothetical protein
MTEPTNVVEMPQVDPEQTAKKIADLSARLDAMPSETTARDLLNFLQDDFLPVLRDVHAETAAALYYAGMHEDRLDAIEQDAGVLDPEEAAHIHGYVSESLEALKRMAKEAKIPGLTDLIKQGEESLQILEDFLPEETETPPGKTHH